MHYIVLDLEWNQPMRREERITDPFPFDSEVIEFGAIRLDDKFRPQGEYRSYVRPSYYPKMNMHVAGLTRIRARDLAAAPAFPEAYRAVESGDCEQAVLPIENSYVGEVGQVTDLMFEGSLYINAVYTLRIRQNLLALPGAHL